MLGQLSSEKVRILVADSREVSGMVLADLLTQFGFMVTCATETDGIAAISLQEKPDMVLVINTDLGVLNGSVIKSLSDHPVTRSIPTIELVRHW